MLRFCTLGIAVLTIQPALGFLPSFSDLFANILPISTSKDNELLGLEEEDGDPRLGFVQVGYKKVFSKMFKCQKR